VATLFIFVLVLVSINSATALDDQTQTSDLQTQTTLDQQNTTEDQEQIIDNSNSGSSDGSDVQTCSTVSSEGTVQTTDIGSVKGYWVWSNYVNSLDPWALKNSGFTDIFVLTKGSSGEFHLDDLRNAINKCYPAGIRVHAWIVCFKDQNTWVDQTNMAYQTHIINDEILVAANVPNISGIHLDYVRYSGLAQYGRAAWQQPGGVDAAVNTITDFVARVRNALNPNLYLSAAVMPEANGGSPDGTYWNRYYYAQDYDRLADFLDFMVPMTYEGNFGQNTAWIGNMIGIIVSKAQKDVAGTRTPIPVFAGLLNYRCDSNPEMLPQGELDADIAEAIGHGAKGYVLFRYGIPRWESYTVPHAYKRVRYRGWYKVSYRVRIGKGKYRRYVWRTKWKRGWLYKWLYWYETRWKCVLT